MQTQLAGVDQRLGDFLPGAHLLPSDVAPPVLHDQRTGILSTWPNGFQKAHRYSAPYGNGISTTISSAIRGSSPREYRLTSVPRTSRQACLPLLVPGLAFACFDQLSPIGVRYGDLGAYSMADHAVDRRGDDGLRPPQVRSVARSACPGCCRW